MCVWWLFNTPFVCIFGCNCTQSIPFYKLIYILNRLALADSNKRFCQKFEPKPKIPTRECKRIVHEFRLKYWQNIVINRSCLERASKRGGTPFAPPKLNEWNRKMFTHNVRSIQKPNKCNSTMTMSFEVKWNFGLFQSACLYLASNFSAHCFVAYIHKNPNKSHLWDQLWLNIIVLLRI